RKYQQMGLSPEELVTLKAMTLANSGETRTHTHSHTHTNTHTHTHTHTQYLSHKRTNKNTEILWKPISECRSINPARKQSEEESCWWGPPGSEGRAGLRLNTPAAAGRACRLGLSCCWGLQRAASSQASVRRPNLGSQRETKNTNV